MARFFGAAVVVVALVLAGCGVNDVAPQDVALSTATLNPLDTGDPIGEVNAVTPSTNADNYAKTPTRWAHVLLDGEARVGELDLKFVSERGFASCFEYRVDESAPDSLNNTNPFIDELWPFTCQLNSSATMTIEADAYVDVRMVFGAESDERFDWTRFYTVPTKSSCMDGGWLPQGFRNQGQCVRFYETGKDSRLGE